VVFFPLIAGHSGEEAGKGQGLAMANTATINRGATGELPQTYFAPAERAEPRLLRERARQAVEDPVIRVVLEAMRGHVLIVDGRRQILAANGELLDMLGASSGFQLIGSRPGEVLECWHAAQGPGGCGTARGCRYCGAVIALLTAQSLRTSTAGECTIATRQSSGVRCVDFRIKVTPLWLGGEQVYAVVLHDVTAEHRRRALERLFIHDVRNVMTGLVGWSELFADSNPSEAAEQVVKLTRQLQRELESHYVIQAAESGELEVAPSQVDVGGLLDRVVSMYRAHRCAARRTLVAEPTGAPAVIATDETLLVRVLGNMVKNALEAVSPGGEVTVGFHQTDEASVFWVHNPGVMPPDVADRVFRERFSTKGAARGLGTHAIRLLGEQYLGGRVDFTSSAERGTRFSLALPREEYASSKATAPQ
jgi:hypothetical protein